MATQFEIVEQINRIFLVVSTQVAGFLMLLDFIHGQSSELLKRHLKEFEDASSEANRELPTQSFRARMYFNSVRVHNQLNGIFDRIFSRVDDHISKQLLSEHFTPHPNNQDSKAQWKQIGTEINIIMLESESDLNSVFEQIGTPPASDDDPFSISIPRYEHPEHFPIE